MAAIRKFAGESAESAVVEPEARAVSAEYGDFVRHYEMISRILAQILLAMLFIALPLSASADSF
jgi:hypothetical protein